MINRSLKPQIKTKNSNFRHKIKLHRLNGSLKSCPSHSKCSKFNLTVNNQSSLNTKKNSSHSTLKKCHLMSVVLFIMIVASLHKDMTSFNHNMTMAKKKIIMLNSNKN